MKNLSMWVILTKDEENKIQNEGKVDIYWLENSIMIAKFYFTELIELGLKYLLNEFFVLIMHKNWSFHNSIKTKWLWNINHLSKLVHK